VLNWFTTRGNPDGAGEVLAALNCDASFWDINQKTFRFGDIITDEHVAWKRVDKMNFSYDFSEVGIGFVVPWEVNSNDSVFGGLVYFVAKATNFDGRYVLHDCCWKFLFEEVAINTRHSTSSIKAHKVVLTRGSRSYGDFKEVGVSEGHVRSDDWRSI
jgi:hypothetical protein